MKKIIAKVFDLEEDEVRRSLLLQLNIFLLITTLLIVKPTVNSLFLSELTSDALPLGYLLTALFAVLGSYYYNQMLERHKFNRIIEATIVISVLSLILFGFALHFELAHGYWLYVPYVWVAIFGLLTASQFWILANLVYNAREAKRVFGFIGAGAIAGGIFGGYLASLLTTIIDSEMLLLVAAVVLSACLPITRFIWKTEIRSLNRFQISSRSIPSAKSPFKLIRESRLLSLIALVIGVSVLVAKLVDYQYSDFASRAIEDPEELTAFFGFWFSTLSLISLLIQLFFTKRVVGIFGVGRSLLWLPGGILIGSLLLLFVPQLWVIVLIKVVDGSLKQSVNKAATELLSIPIPIEIKKKTKTFTDVVVDSIATGMAGIILLLFVNAFDISSTFVSLLVVLLISVWIVLIIRLRKAYIISFKHLLHVEEPRREREAKKDFKVTSIVDTVLRCFKTGTENQVLHMLRKTLEVKDERFFYGIKGLLSHPSARIRALAIENLYYLYNENLSSVIEGMVYDKDQDVTTEAFRYLLKHYPKDPVELFSRYLNSSDITISNAALIGLAQELRNNIKLQDRYHLDQHIEHALKIMGQYDEEEQKTNIQEAVLLAIGHARVNPFYHLIHSFINKTDEPDLVKTAIKSAGLTLEPQFIDPLIDLLSWKDHRSAAADALFRYGEPIIDILVHKVKSEIIDHQDSKFTVLVIERFASQRAVDALMSLTRNTEHQIKVEAIEALKRLKWKHKHLLISDRFIIDQILDECQLYQTTLSVMHAQIIIQFKMNSIKTVSALQQKARVGLINLLENRLDRQLERIFRFLGLKYPPDDVDPIFDSIKKGKEEQRVHALEFLDNILDKHLKKELIPLTESIISEPNTADRLQKVITNPLSEIESFHLIFKRKDFKLKMAVLHLIGTMDNNDFQDVLMVAIEDSDKRIRQKASEILKFVP